MSAPLEKNGSCLCGAVKITAHFEDSGLGACHCGMCQKWGGGAFMALNAGSNVTIEGKENISTFNSSDWAERAFCAKCGTHLYYKLKEPNQHILSLGLFEDKNGFVFDHQIFIDRKCDLYSFAEKTHDMTEQEVIEKYFK